VKQLLALSMALALVAGAAQASEAATRVKVSADSLRMVQTDQGEAARAEGNVTIEIPGQVRIHAPKAQLIKGPDGKMARAVFPGWVRVEDLTPNKKGTWKTEHNNGGYYDFKTGGFTEVNPRGTYEFEVREPAGGAKAKPTP
jgi:lipopolysaccharide export system protein LptA